MDLPSLLTTLRRWAWLIGAGAVLAGGTAYVISVVRMPPATYQAEAMVLVGPALDTIHADSGQMDAARRLSLVYVEVAQSRPLLARVAEGLDLATDEDVLRQQLVVETSQEPPIISITAVARDPTLAAALANAVARELTEIAPSLDGGDQQARRFMERQTEALEQEIETLIAEVERLAADPTRTEAEDQRLVELQSRLGNLRGTYAALVSALSPTSANQVRIIEEAEPDPRPLPTGRLQTVILATLLGIVTAAGIAYAVERLDDKVRRPHEVASLTQVPVLGDIARVASASRLAMDPAQSALADDPSAGGPFQTLRTNIELSGTTLPRSLVVASARGQEGRTTVAVHLAAALALSGKQVLLVDADLRQPDIGRLLNLPDGSGFGDFLATRDKRLSDLVQQASVPRLRVLTAGQSPDGPSVLLDVSRVRSVIAKLRQSAEVIIIDSPAMLNAPEARVLASAAEATLLVVAAGRTSTTSLHAVLDALAVSRASLIGTVVNRTPASVRRPTRKRADKPVSRHGHSFQEDHLGS